MKLTVVTVKQPTLMSLKLRSDELKSSAKNCDWEADHNFCWDQKKLVDKSD